MFKALAFKKFSPKDAIPCDHIAADSSLIIVGLSYALIIYIFYLIFTKGVDASCDAAEGPITGPAAVSPPPRALTFP